MLPHRNQEQMFFLQLSCLSKQAKCWREASSGGTGLTQACVLVTAPGDTGVAQMPSQSPGQPPVQRQVSYDVGPMATSSFAFSSVSFP